MADENKGKEEYPSLYEAFKLGERVKRVYRGNGKTEVYKGIVLAITDDEIEVYWDTKDGDYRPDDMNVGFTNCTPNEIFKGKGKYSPIRKEE